MSDLDVGVAPLLDLPGRFLAPVLGLSFSSSIEPAPLPLFISGPPVTGKSTLARLGIEFFDPAYDSELVIDVGGSSARGLRDVLWRSQRGPLVLESIYGWSIGLMRDLTPRLRDREGRKIRAGQVIVPEPSGVSVIAVVGDVRVAEGGYRIFEVVVRAPFFPVDHVLTTRASRVARAALGSAYRDWCSGVDDPREDGVQYAIARWGALDQWGLLRNPAAANQVRFAAYSMRGIELFARFIEAEYPGSADLARELVEWAHVGLWEALNDSANVDDGGRLLRLLWETLQDESSGRCWYVLGRDTPDARGECIGLVKGSRLYLIPQRTVTLLRERYPDRADGIDSRSVGAALEESRLLAVGGDGGRSVPRRINGKLIRAWDVSIGLLASAAEQYPAAPRPHLHVVE